MKGGEKLPTHTFHHYRSTSRLAENRKRKKIGKREEEEQQQQRRRGKTIPECLTH